MPFPNLGTIISSSTAISALLFNFGRPTLTFWFAIVIATTTFALVVVFLWFVYDKIYDLVHPEQKPVFGGARHGSLADRIALFRYHRTKSYRDMHRELFEKE